jgi:hypothetical protein
MLLAAVALLSLSLLVVGATAASVAKSSGNKDSVTGGFHDVYGFNNGVQASSGPSGENPTGHAGATNLDTGEKIHEDAVCVAVSDNLAATGMVGTLNGTPYTEILLYRAGGPGVANGGFASIEENGEDPHNCQSHLLEAAGAPAILGGIILIRDATP